MLQRFGSKPALILLGITMILGGFLRLYRMPETLMFQGDQGRDAIVVKNMIKHGDYTLIGPVTSVGNMYLGPFYYYFMLPFLLISYPDPIGPAYGVALMGILTIGLIYVVGREMFGTRAGLMAAFGLSTMAVVVTHSRFSWNPNLAPFFSLLAVWGVYRYVKNKDLKWLLLASGAASTLAQLHYLALLLFPPLFVYLIWGWYKNKTPAKTFIIHSAVALINFLLAFIPLMIFDLRHNHLISQGFSEFFTNGNDSHLARDFIRIIKEWEGRSFRFLAQLMGSPNGLIDRILAYPLILFMIINLTRMFKSKKASSGVGLISLILLMGIMGSAFYDGTLFDHYLLYATPLLMLLYGLILSTLSRKKVLGLVMSFMIMGIYLYGNMPKMPTFMPGGTRYTDYQVTASNILVHAPNARYNIALLSDSKDYRGMNYRYFLEVSDNPPVQFEDYENLTRLFVIDELNITHPLSTHIYEIEHPNLRKIMNSFTLPSKITIYELGPLESNEETLNI